MSPYFLELIKTTTEAGKQFLEMMYNFLWANPIDSAIAEAHKQVIQNVIDRESPTEETIEFLCGYKKLIKQEKRKKDIVCKALNFLNKGAGSKPIDGDWLEFFFEKAKLVSNMDMQLIWSKLLAEEANSPGRISMSLLHSISIMRYDQAQFFCNISRFAMREFKGDHIHPLLFVSTNRVAYESSGITYEKLKELERLGVIECNFDREYIFRKKKILSSGNHVLKIYGDPQNGDKIKAGNVVFTTDGEMLYSIIDEAYKEHRPSIVEFTIKKFRARNCQVTLNDKGTW